MTKRILVLAASRYQIPTIVAAKKRGYQVITVDNVASNPGHALSDASFCIDNTDSVRILKLATEQGIDGVIAPATDVAVQTAAFLADRLGIAGPTLAAARILTNKIDFRQFQYQLGLVCPRFHCFEPRCDPAPSLFDGRCWVIKPNQSSGSKGVFIVTSRSDYQRHEAESRSFSRDGTIIVEEMMEGTQHTCEGLLDDGRVALALVTDRDTAAPPNTATLGHRVPSRLPVSIQDRALHTISSICNRLGLIGGPFDCDFVVNGGQIFIIELTPRLGGNSLSMLFEAALDVNLVDYAVRYACGEPTTLLEPASPTPSAVIILGVERAGLLAWDSSEAVTLLGEPWVRYLTFDQPAGSEVQGFTDGRHRVGEALVVGSDRGDVDRRIDELRRRLRVSVA